MLIKYMGPADYRGFAIGDTLGGRAPALPVNVIFSKDTGIDPNDHIIDTTGAAYSGVDPTWWTALLTDSNFMNVTGLTPVPAGAWDSLYGFETQPTSSSDGDVPLSQKGVANGVATLDAGGQVPLAQLGHAPSGGGGGAPSGAAGGDLSGTYPSPGVAKVQGVAITAAAAQLAAQLNEAVVRSTTSTLAAGESTVFSGSTAGQTLTMPASTVQVSSPNAIINLATVNVTITAGAGTTLNYMGVVGNITLTPNMSIRALLIGTVWYVFDASFGSAGGDLSGSYPSPTVARLNGLAASAYALLASPAFTGNPTATTQAGSDNSTRLATTAFVQAATALSLALTGGTMSGAIAMGNHAITGLATPVNPADAVTKAYADALVAGLSTHAAAQWATTAALPSTTYVNGASGVGATLTATANGALTVDGNNPALNDRILVKDQTTPLRNGVYTLTQLGDGTHPFILTRATDLDQAAEIPGAYVFVEGGTVNAGAGFVVALEGPIVVGTNDIVWTQFSGAGEILAGTGIAKAGNTLSLQSPVTAANGGTGQTTLAGVTLDKWGAAVAAVSMGGQKITNVANGTAASDVAAFGQIPTALPPNGAASGDLGGTYPGPSVTRIQGVAQTASTATLLSQMNNAIVRSTSAAMQPGEETVFSGSTAAQTLTLPGSTTQASSINKIVNIASVNVTVAPGTGTTLNNLSVIGNVTVIPGGSVELVLIGTVWYVFMATSPQAGSANTVPISGGKLVVLGHSYASGAGANPPNHGWAGLVSSMMRAKLWNQAVGGAILSIAEPPGSTNFGGIAQCLQNVLPTPQPVNWRGAWVSGAYYAPDDGVTSAIAVASCSTTNGSPTLTTTGSFTTSGVVAGQVVSGAGVKPGTYVKSVQSATSLTLNQNATATGTQTNTFTGWYRQGALTLSDHGTTQPTGVNSGVWVLTTPPAISNGIMANGGLFGNGGSWASAPYLPIVMYGLNDLGFGFQKNIQPFLSALQCLLARLSCAVLWEDNSPNIIYAGGTWTFAAWSGFGTFGSGSGETPVPNTTGATFTVNTPPDFPGGFVDIGFVVGKAQATGAINFTLDGSNVNAKCNGMADGPLVSFGSPSRQMRYGTSLTTALAAGVAVTSLAVRSTEQAITAGDTITVGGGPGQGAADTFVASGAVGANAVAIPVTSHAPTNAHAIGDSVADTTAGAWLMANNVVVRVPVPAGPHAVVGTVQAGTTVANLALDWVGFEAVPVPTGVVIGLQKPLSGAFWPGVVLDSDVDTWNTAITNMIGAGNEFPHSYVNIGNILKQSSALNTALTQGQAGVTALDVTNAPVLQAIAAGDTLIIGSGGTQETCVVSAPAIVGATSISVNSFTTTFAHPVGTPVTDLNYAQNNFNVDGVHPNLDGHALTATLVWNAIQAAVSSMTQVQVAAQTVELQGATAFFVNGGGGNIAVGTGVAGAWGIVSGVQIVVSAEPGDLIELTFEGQWDTSSTVNGFLDLATINNYNAGAGQAYPGYVQNYVSGVGISTGSPATNMGLGWQYIGGQSANGLSPLASTEGITTVTEKISGKFLYPVQPADIQNGQVYFQLLGKSSTTAVRNILNTAGNQFAMSARNVGPQSVAGYF